MSDRDKLIKRSGKHACEDDLGFADETSAAILQRTPRGGRAILWTVLLFFIAFLAWAYVAELDEITRGVGKVVPSTRMQVVQNLEGGIIRDILVEEGDLVRKGQPLLRLDPTQFASSFEETRLRYSSLKAKAARLRAEAEGKSFQAPESVAEDHPALVEQERELFRARQQELENRRAILERQRDQKERELAEQQARERQLSESLRLLRRELELTSPLVKDGAISEVEVLRLRRQVNETRGELEAVRLSIPRLRSKLEEYEQRLEQVEMEFRNKARQELNDAVAEIARLSKSLEALEDRVRRTLVKSPVRGTVNQVKVSTEGGVIKPGMDLVEIVPLDDTLLVEARIRPADIAFLHPGQKAVVKFTAYDFAIYGGLEGQVENISADTITDEEGNAFYQVRVRTDQNFLGSASDPLPLIPGMRATVDIMTGKKTVLEYLLKPVLRAKEQALTER